MLGGDWEVSTLTDDKRNQSVLTPTVTETELGGQDFGALTPEEERVLRMRHGLTEGPEHMLSFAVGANEETMLKLAMMEKNLIEAFAKADAPQLDLDSGHIEAKSKIISALRGDE